MENKIRLVFISDTHRQHRDVEIPKCDLLIHSGDLSSRGELRTYKSFNDWIGELKDGGIIKEACVTAGNHDLTLDQDRGEYRPDAKDLFTNCHLLLHEEIELFGLKIFMSPYSPEFCGWGFPYNRGDEAEARWSNIPECDILTTHTPPFGILDYTLYDQKSVGCEALIAKIYSSPPLIHSFGHVHESFGIKEVSDLRTLFVNASSCTLRYKPTNAPIVVDVWKENDKWECELITV